MDRLEALIDLGGDGAHLVESARGASASLAGAADVAVLAWQLMRDGNTPTWFSAIGLESMKPLEWLRSRTNRYTNCARVAPIPIEIIADVPTSPLVRFQDESASLLGDAGIPRPMALKLIGAFAEMCDNAIDHSESPIVALATFEITRDWWEFSVSDFGRGIPTSLRANHSYANLSDRDAVREALQDGVTRFQNQDRGLGYGVLLRALAEHDCTVRLRSGAVVVRWSGVGIGLTNLVYELVGPRVGLHVRASGQLLRSSRSR